MKAPRHSPPPLHSPPTLRPSPRHLNLVFDLQICSDNFSAADFGRPCAGDGDHDSRLAGKDLHTENHVLYSSDHIAEILPHEDDRNEDDDDDDDDLPWANRRSLSRPPARRSGYGDFKSFHRAVSNARGKRNLVRFPRKTASFTIAIARQQRSGLIRPHSGSLAGPLTPVASKYCNGGPSIIPVSFIRCKKLNFNACEPMSPEVTCLGRIRNKELPRKFSSSDTTDGDKLSLDSQTSHKGRCFDTKTQLCGKRGKGRKKKDKCRGLPNARRKKFSSAGSKSFPSPESLELGQTRRERAAALAMSLNSLIEGMRQAEKERTHYVPSVPPPNSLLLMRGCRQGNEDMDLDAGRDEQAVEDNMGVALPEAEPSVPPPNSLLLMRGCRVRRDRSFSQELKVSRALMDEEAYVNSVTQTRGGGDEVHHVKKLKARAAKHLSLLDWIDAEENHMDQSASTSEAGHVQACNVDVASDKESHGKDRAVVEMVMSKFSQEGHIQEPYSRPTLYQRRCFCDLPAIQVGRRTKMDR